MASQGLATGGLKRKRGFTQTADLNARIPGLQSILASRQAKKIRKEDVAFREREFAQSRQQAKDSAELQRQQQRAQFGLEVAKTGINLSTNPATSGKTFGGLFGDIRGKLGGSSAPTKGFFSNLNIGQTVGSGLTGFGASGLFQKKGAKLLAGVGGGLLSSLAGGASTAAGLGGGALFGGLGGLAGGLLG